MLVGFTDVAMANVSVALEELKNNMVKPLTDGIPNVLGITATNIVCSTLQNNSDIY